MRRKIATTVVGVVLVTLCSGASCRQETAQGVLATFLNTLAETAAQQLVSNAAKPIQFADRAYSAPEERRCPTWQRLRQSGSRPYLHVLVPNNGHP